MEKFFTVEPNFILPEKGNVGVSKYTSKKSALNIYFVDVDSSVVNGYFCFGTDQPEAGGIEQLINHLDSSGGLLPRTMRGDMLRPAWQFHGAENPLADRDQSCYVCCALGEPAFLGTFSCAAYLLQNIETVMEMHGYNYQLSTRNKKSDSDAKAPKEKGDAGELAAASQAVEEAANALNLDEDDADRSDDEEPKEPKLEEAEYYCLSEAGEGAMAWEGTLQSMFPGTPAFWNRLLNDGKCHRLSSRMRRCYDRLYRPDNLSVIITGRVKNRGHILEVMHDYESEYFENHKEIPTYENPWSSVIPQVPESVENTAYFVCRNPRRKPLSTVCLGWRSVPATDVETAMAIKVLTAMIAVGPMWTKLVTAGHAHRISWCQLEYINCCSLITIHGINEVDMAGKVGDMMKQTLHEMVSGGLKLEDVAPMADRVGWHYIRELESEPYLMIASAIAKAERYGRGEKEQVLKRLRPRMIFDSLQKKPLAYWKGILEEHFVKSPMFCTKVIPKKLEEDEQPAGPSTEMVKEDASGDMNFAASSRRAASRPRRGNNAVAQESNVAVEDDNRNVPVLPKEEKDTGTRGLLEEHLLSRPFPLGDFEEERQEFESRLDVTREFLDNVLTGEFPHWPIKCYRSDSKEQHKDFPLQEMPFFTFLEDTNTSFVYLTVVIDTSHLNEQQRKMLPSVTAALGGFICPRPPDLDTDAEIKNPNEFNPPLDIADSQVSIGLNGEMMQSIFLTVIVRPEKYAWAVGLIHYILYEAVFDDNFLRFIGTEAARGLSANYKMQTAEQPNYHSFDSVEINLHSIIKQVYKSQSNARLFVGRRRLDLMMEYLGRLKENPSQITSETNATWKSLVSGNRVSLQVAAKVEDLCKVQGDCVAPWKKYFAGIQRVKIFKEIRPTFEPEVMNMPSGTGIVVSVNHLRLPCLSIAVPINPHGDDFPKLCMAAQLFSMAQKWIWACWDLDDLCSPVIRMPCSYANLMTLNLESYDVLGSLKTMQSVMNGDWSWVGPLLTATKLMVINDPASLELGAQGTIASALLSHLADFPIETRRDLLKNSMAVTVNDITEVSVKYLGKFFDPKESCCALMSSETEDRAVLVKRLEEMGYKMQQMDLEELCTNL